MSALTWKPGRGKLGPLAPLLGRWMAEGDSPAGAYRCTRELTPVLGGKYVQARVQWLVGGRPYEELALYGIDAEGRLAFWSFTSDGKSSRGVVADASDIHPQALAFESEMPAGLARMAYWPDPERGYRWAVESRTKRGWNRFTEHHYAAVP